MTTATQTSNQEYFNLTTTATGYFNRLRVVAGKGKAPAYFALDFNALNGAGFAESEQKRFTLTVKGKQANEVIESLLVDYTDKTKLFGKVEIADFAPDSYVNKAGETVLFMKGRLIKVHFVTKNGTRVFNLEKTAEPDAADVPKAKDAKDAKDAAPELPPAHADDIPDDAAFDQSTADMHAEMHA